MVGREAYREREGDPERREDSSLIGRDPSSSCLLRKETRFSGELISFSCSIRREERLLPGREGRADVSSKFLTA